VIQSSTHIAGQVHQSGIVAYNQYKSGYRPVWRPARLGKPLLSRTIDQNHLKVHRTAMQELSLSNIIEQIFNPKRSPSTYGQLINEIDQHGMAVVLILFALPSALPLPAAGYSTVLSIPLFMIGFRFIFGSNTIWLPNRLRNKTFNPQQFSPKLVHGMLRLIHFVEYFSKPRLTPLVRSQAIYRLLGVLIIALAFSMLLPIPGTNTAPAFGIFLIGFALLEDDGVMLIVGILASLVALVISFTVIFFGYKSILWLKDTLRGLF
jgi:hypothetical protein